VLESARLRLRMANRADVPEIIRFYRENAQHLSPFEPERSEEFYTELYWEAQVDRHRQDFEDDRALRMWLFRRDDDRTIQGNVHLSNFIRGVKQSCTLGYALAATAQGHGYMTEILRVAIGYAFGDLAFHRIEANYMPHNVRSGQVLKRLGFRIEGYAYDYLCIGGQWRDHLLTSLTAQCDPLFQAPGSPFPTPPHP
jgi:ribosomal-protein-alanine N-acetyltransferase